MLLSIVCFINNSQSNHLMVRVCRRPNICFTSDADLEAYAHWFVEGAERFDVAVHGLVFMTNHVHLLAIVIELNYT